MTSPFSSTRIAPLMDDNVFELPANPPLVTMDKMPWLRWANVGECSGWYTLGTRHFRKDDHGEDFWLTVCRLAAEVGNGRADACHCLGPGVLSIGGLAVTLESGYGAPLLARCLTEAPLHWVWTMAPAIQASGTYLRTASGALDNVAMEHLEHGELREQEQFNGAVRGGSSGDRWTGNQKRRAHVWVESVSRMLSHPAMDHAQANFCRDHLPTILGPAAGILQWPSNGIQDGWMFTTEQRALWAAGMVLVIEDEKQALQALKDCVKFEPEDARGSLRNLRELGERGSPLVYSDAFRKRVAHTAARVQEVFHFHLGDG